MIDQLNKIILNINSHGDWDNNTKIRYAYLELGKLVSKDAMFFYTIQNNLLTQEKDKIQYDFKTVNKIMNTENLFDYKVICRSSAEMLNYIFSKCNINSEIRKFTDKTDYVTDEGKVEIIHYFVVAEGNENKKYFLTLNPDLPNIQLGRRTSHFANHIGYLNEVKETDEKGNEFISIYPRYEGEEIEHSVMSFDEIKKIDEKLGYVDNKLHEDELNKDYTDVFFDMIKEAYKFNDRYMDVSSTQTRFYYDLSNLLNGNMSFDEIIESDYEPSEEEIKESTASFDIKEKSNEEWNDIRRFVLLNVILKVYNDYDIEITDRVVNGYYELLDNRKYNEIFNSFKRDFFRNPENKNKINNLGDTNPLLKVKQVTFLCSKIDDYEDKKTDIKTFKNDLQKYIGYVAKLFIPELYLPSSIYLSNVYLTHKIMLSFEEIFDIGHKTKFNDMEIAEQVIIIKELLDSVIQEKVNIKDQMLCTVVFNKESKKPYYLICVKNFDYYKYKNLAYTPILFDLKENKLITDKSLAEIYDENYVIKDANLKLMIEEIDDNLSH